MSNPSLDRLDCGPYVDGPFLKPILPLPVGNKPSECRSEYVYHKAARDNDRIIASKLSEILRRGVSFPEHNYLPHSPINVGGVKRTGCVLPGGLYGLQVALHDSDGYVKGIKLGRAVSRVKIKTRQAQQVYEVGKCIRPLRCLYSPEGLNELFEQAALFRYHDHIKICQMELFGPREIWGSRGPDVIIWENLVLWFLSVYRIRYSCLCSAEHNEYFEGLTVELVRKVAMWCHAFLDLASFGDLTDMKPGDKRHLLSFFENQLDLWDIEHTSQEYSIPRDRTHAVESLIARLSALFGMETHTICKNETSLAQSAYERWAQGRVAYRRYCDEMENVDIQYTPPLSPTTTSSDCAPSSDSEASDGELDDDPLRLEAISTRTRASTARTTARSTVDDLDTLKGLQRMFLLVGASTKMLNDFPIFLNLESNATVMGKYAALMSCLSNLSHPVHQTLLHSIELTTRKTRDGYKATCQSPLPIRLRQHKTIVHGWTWIIAKLGKAVAALNISHGADRYEAEELHEVVLKYLQGLQASTEIIEEQVWGWTHAQLTHADDSPCGTPDIKREEESDTIGGAKREQDAEMQISPHYLLQQWYRTPNVTLWRNCDRDESESEYSEAASDRDFIDDGSVYDGSVKDDSGEAESTGYESSEAWSTEAESTEDESIAIMAMRFGQLKI